MAEAVFLGFVIVTIALGVGLMVVREIRAARADMLAVARRLRDDLADIRYMLLDQESERIRRAARYAQIRLEAEHQGRPEAEERVNVARVVDEHDAERWERRGDALAEARDLEKATDRWLAGAFRRILARRGSHDT